MSDSDNNSVNHSEEEEEGEPGLNEEEAQQLMQDPNFLNFFIRMMQQDQQRKDEERRVARIKPEKKTLTLLRSRKGELSQLVQNLPGNLPKEIWQYIVLYLGAKDVAKASQTCWAFRELCDLNFVWEKIFSSEVGGVSLCPKSETGSWRERFFTCQRFDKDLVTALISSEPEDEVILCKGVYKREPEEGSPFGTPPLRVNHPLHIVGCDFSKKYAANKLWNHPMDVNNAISTSAGNIVILGEDITALEWAAAGGSIRNVDIRYLNPDAGKYYFSLKVGTGNDKNCHVDVFNCGIESQQQMGVSVQPGSSCRIVNSRLSNSGGCGISVLDGAKAVLQGCLIDYNSSGISVNSGSVVVQDCVIHSNKLEGVGICGEGATVSMKGVNCFHHKLNGVEVFNDADQEKCEIEQCNLHNNLNGIQWWTPNDDAAELQSKLEKQNDVHDNRRLDVKVRKLEAGRSVVEEAVKENICTYLTTGPHFFKHMVWSCITCGLHGRTGCCQVCAQVCHAGHDVRELRESSFYCDCGEGFQGCHFRQDVSEKVEEKEILGKSKK